ncbi:MAG: insulinase family protein [Chloroflexi bacterium]|nr:insulinase family protein [Chloroflexota bacterium]
MIKSGFWKYGRGLLFVIFIIFLVSASAGAKDYPQFKRIKLDNGATILLSKMPDTQVAAVNIFMKVGSSCENSSTNGSAHFFEHMVFKGTKYADTRTFLRDVDEIGAQANAFTGKDFTRYYMMLPSSRALEAVDLLGSALEFPAIPENELDMERRVILNEYNIHNDSVPERIGEMIYAMSFPSRPYGRPIIGTRENISRFTSGDIRNFHDRYYRPEKMVWVVAGNFDEKAVVDRIKKWVSRAPGTNNDLPEENFQDSAGGAPVFFTDMGKPVDYGQSDFRPFMHRHEEMESQGDAADAGIAFPAPSVKDRKYIYAADVLTFALSMGDEAMLPKILINEKRAVSQVSANFLTQKDPGIFIILMETTPEDLGYARDLLFKTLGDIKVNGLPENQLERAKNLIMTEHLMSMAGPEGVSEVLGFFECIDTAEFASSYMENISKVTNEDIRDFCSYMERGGFMEIDFTQKKRSPSWD